MQIEVVAYVMEAGNRVSKTFTFKVENPPELEEGGDLTVTDEKEDQVAEFVDWAYWRKIGD